MEKSLEELLGGGFAHQDRRELNQLVEDVGVLSGPNLTGRSLWLAIHHDELKASNEQTISNIDGRFLDQGAVQIQLQISLADVDPIVPPLADKVGMGGRDRCILQDHIIARIAPDSNQGFAQRKISGRLVNRVLATEKWHAEVRGL